MIDDGEYFVAKNTSVQLLDDLSGEPAEESVRFALDGVQYDIDLAGDNADALREILEPYMHNGRRTGGRKRAARIIATGKPRRSTNTQSAKRTSKTAGSGRGTAKNPAQSSAKTAGKKATQTRGANKKTATSSTRTATSSQRATGTAKQAASKSSRTKSAASSSTTSAKKTGSAKTSRAAKSSAPGRKSTAAKFSSQ